MSKTPTTGPAKPVFNYAAAAKKASITPSPSNPPSAAPTPPQTQANSPKAASPATLAPADAPQPAAPSITLDGPPADKDNLAPARAPDAAPQQPAKPRAKAKIDFNSLFQAGGSPVTPTAPPSSQPEAPKQPPAPEPRPASVSPAPSAASARPFTPSAQPYAPANGQPYPQPYSPSAQSFQQQPSSFAQSYGHHPGAHKPNMPNGIPNFQPNGFQPPRNGSFSGPSGVQPQQQRQNPPQQHRGPASPRPGSAILPGGAQQFVPQQQGGFPQQWNPAQQYSQQYYQHYPGQWQQGYNASSPVNQQPGPRLPNQQPPQSPAANFARPPLSSANTGASTPSIQAVSPAPSANSNTPAPSSTTFSPSSAAFYPQQQNGRIEQSSIPQHISGHFQPASPHFQPRAIVPQSPLPGTPNTAGFQLPPSASMPKLSSTATVFQPRASKAIKIVNPKAKAEEDAKAKTVVPETAAPKSEDKPDDAKLKADEEAKVKAEQEAKAKADAELKAKEEAEKKQKEEAEAREKAEIAEKARLAADAKLAAEKAEEEAKQKAEEEAKAAEKAKLEAEEEAKKLAEEEQKKKEQELKESVQKQQEAEREAQAKSDEASAAAEEAAEKSIAQDAESSTTKKARPASLDLSKDAPSGPSTALASARSIEDLTDVSYPSHIKAPKPELNNSAKPGKFRYDRDFLLQFMNLCKERPDQLPALEAIGMIDEGPGGINMPRGGSGRGQNRGPSSNFGNQRMASHSGPVPMPRSTSSNNFGMGNFGAPPSALTSEQRFAQSNASFGRGGPGQMARQPSTGPMGGRNSSIRRSGPGSRRSQPSQSGPSNLGTDSTHTFEALQQTESAWKGGRPKPGAAGQDEDSPEMVNRKVKALLNKLTVENFESISKQILAWANKSEKETDGRILKQVIALIFEKATDEAHWSEMYARLCLCLQHQLSTEIKAIFPSTTEGKPDTVAQGGSLFRKYLLTRCQEDYERGWAQKEKATAAAAGKAADDNAKREAAMKEAEAKGEKPSAQAVDFSDEYYAAEKAKRRGLGLVRFIGELYKLQMLNARIIYECVKKLINNVGSPEEEDIESLCRLLNTAGKQLDETTVKDARAKGVLDIYYGRLREVADNKRVPSRLCFMIMDLLDLRSAKWVSKNGPTGPKLLSQIHDDAARQHREDEMKRASSGRGMPRITEQLGRVGSRGGRARDGGAPGPDGWTTTIARPPSKAGDLSQLGKVRSSSSTVLGPGGSRKMSATPSSQEKTSDSAQRANAFALLDEADAAALSTSPPVEMPQRKRLQLLPKTTGGDDETKEEAEETPVEEAGMSEEAANRSIDNSVKEFFSIKNIEEGVETFKMLPAQYRSTLVQKLVSGLLGGRGAAGNVDPLCKLFSAVQSSEPSLLSTPEWSSGFKPTIVELEDLAADLPKAYEFVAKFLVAASVPRSEVEALSKDMTAEDEDMVEEAQARLMETFDKTETA